MTPLEHQIAQHYEQPDLLERLLRHVGIKSREEVLSIDALQGCDEFHTGGVRATELALDLVPFTEGMRVLDAGCGIGGAARRIVSRYGCYVTGIDITEDYVRIAKHLSDQMQLQDACDFHASSVLSTPFPDNEFAATVSFHVAMNIESRSEFYREINRVTRPSGWFLSYDLVRGANARSLDFPLPWSQSSDTSFVKTAEETVALMKESGFDGIELYQLPELKKQPQQQEAERPINVLLGCDAEQKATNHRAALSDQRLLPLFFVARVKSD